MWPALLETDDGIILEGPVMAPETFYAWEPDPCWRCQACPWEARDTTHSAAYRAENHARETGHTVLLLMDRDDPFDYVIPVEEYIRQDVASAR